MFSTWVEVDDVDDIEATELAEASGLDMKVRLRTSHIRGNIENSCRDISIIVSAKVRQNFIENSQIKAAKFRRYNLHIFISKKIT